MHPPALSGHHGEVIAESSPTTAFDVALIVHVLVAVVALVVLGSSYVAAMSLGGLRAGEAWSDASERFFSPGPEIGGRTIYLVPLTGFALLGMSGGEFSMSDPFIGIGLALSVLAIAAGEAFVFPSAKKLADVISIGKVVPQDDAWRQSLTRLRWGVDAMALALVAGAIVMVAQP
jgi:hypothetical protein